MPEPPFGRIVVPLRGRGDEQSVIDFATRLASPFNVAVVGLHVDLPNAAMATDPFEDLYQACIDCKIAMQRALRSSENVPAAILDELRANDLVVMGTDRLGTIFRQGSISEQVVSHAPCPVTLLQEGRFKPEQ